MTTAPDVGPELRIELGEGEGELLLKVLNEQGFPIGHVHVGHFFVRAIAEVVGRVLAEEPQT